MSSDEPPSKRARTHPTYELLYHPSIPGRGEFIRLLLEASATPYTDLARDNQGGGYATVKDICINPTSTSSADGNPPVFSPPALRVKEEGLVLGQTPNILAFLGERTGMDGGPERKWFVQQVALTALDLNNEVHDTHHPVGLVVRVEKGSD